MKIGIIYFNGRTSYLTWGQMGILVSVLNNQNCHQVEVFHVEENKVEVAVKAIKDFHPDLILIYLKFKTYATMRIFLENFYACHICVCYSLPTIFPLELLKENYKIDSLIRGEIEYTVVELTNRLEHKQSLYGCKGVIFRNSAGEIVDNGIRTTRVQYAALPYSERESFPTDKRFFHVLASRGCIGTCSFCNRDTVYKFGKKSCFQLFRPIKDVVDEIEDLVRKYQCKYIGFSDSTFCGNINGKYGIQRLRELYNELKKRDFRIEFFLNLRSEQITEDLTAMLQNLVQVGLSMVFVGFESFVPEDLKIYNKIASVENNSQAAELLVHASELMPYYLNIEYGFINFNPYSTVDNICININTLMRLNIGLSPTDITSIVDVRYGCRLYDIVLADGLCTQEINLYTQSVAFEFVNKDVGLLYQRLKTAFQDYEIKTPGGFASLYNRYVFFYGPTQLSDDIRTLYISFKNRQTDYTFKLFDFIVNSLNEPENIVEDGYQQFNSDYQSLKNMYVMFANKYRRLMMELKK